MRFLEGIGIALEQAYADEDAALDAAEEFLQQHGHGRRRVQRAMLLSARVDSVWWSDRLGFTHDCSQHDPGEATRATCDPLTRRVPMVLGLPAALTRPRMAGVEEAEE